jgi:hypothetical protein
MFRRMWLRVFWRPDGGGDGGNSDPTPGGDPPKTFTQEQLDAIIADRLQRERGKYADYEDLKKAKGELDALKAGQLSEAEKLNKRAAEAETKAQAAEARLRETVTRLEVERQARKLGIVDEDAAYRLLNTSAITLDDDGKPSNIEALLKDLVKAKPYLAAQPAASSGSPTNPARTGAGASDAFTAALYKGAGLKKE